MSTRDHSAVTSNDVVDRCTSSSHDDNDNNNNNNNNSQQNHADEAVKSSADLERKNYGGAQEEEEEEKDQGGANNNTSTNASHGATSKFILGMSKPVFAAVVAIVLASTGAGLWGWMSIPGLNAQIQELQTSVHRLQGEVDRLEKQNDRYETLNQELNTTVGNLELVNRDLNATAGRLAMSGNELNASVVYFQMVNDQLTRANVRYSALNDKLQVSANNLSDQVHQLYGNMTHLARQNQELENITIAMTHESERLNTINDDLSETNDMLSSVNTDLFRIVSFLNETTDTINHTLDGLTRAIAEQIQLSHVATVHGLENRFVQQSTFWDCAFRDVFRGEPFIVNEDSPLLDTSSSDFTRVMEYVEDRVLSKLCLDLRDFESYVLKDKIYCDRTTVATSCQLSANKLYRAVAVYTTAALNYYFPDKGQQEGLTVDDWAQANYDCHRVPPFTFDSG